MQRALSDAHSSRYFRRFVFPPFEDKFELEQTIYTGTDFTVERWRRLYHSDPPLLEPEEWPFPQ